jgi:hypothetical protein
MSGETHVRRQDGPLALAAFRAIGRSVRIDNVGSVHPTFGASHRIDMLR